MRHPHISVKSCAHRDGLIHGSRALHPLHTSASVNAALAAHIPFLFLLLPPELMHQQIRI